MPAHHTTVDVASFSPVDSVAPPLVNPDHAHSESALHPVGGQRGLDHRPCRRAHVRADVRVVVDEYDSASGRQPSRRLGGGLDAGQPGTGDHGGLSPSASVTRCRCSFTAPS